MRKDVGAALIACLTALLLPAEVFGNEVQVRVEVVPGTGPVAKVPGTLQVSARTAEETRTVSISVPGTTILSLDGSLAWDLNLEAKGLWSDPAFLPPGGSRTVVITVWPAGVVTGVIATAQRENSITSATLRFAPSEDQAEKGPTGQVTCPVNSQGHRFSCWAPAGKMNFGLRVRDFVSHFAWNVTLSPGGRFDLGRVELQRGASMIGWIETIDASPLTAQCRVILEPEGLPGTERSAGMALRILETRPNADGFFHFDNVAPGLYALVASQPDFVDAVVRGVQILQDEESELREPVTLSLPAKLGVDVEPTIPPSGEQWTLRLVSRDARSRGREFGPAQTDTTGYGSFERVPFGSYVLVVEDEGSHVRHSEEVSIDFSFTSHTVQLDILPVRGTIHIGREPIAASIWFGGMTGSDAVRIESNEDGRFETVLPRSGLWKIEVSANDPVVRTITRKVVDKPPQGKEYTELDIRLPNTKVSGMVIGSHDLPIKDGWIVRLRPIHPDAGLTYIEPMGSAGFEARGFQPGKVRLIAEAGGDWSDELEVMVSDGAEVSDLRLVVEPRREVVGHVVSPAGPVAGALVLAQPRGRIVADADGAVTGADGGFQLRVPEDETSFFVWLQAPGIGFRTFTTPLLGGTPESPLQFEVDANGGMLTLDHSAVDMSHLDGAGSVFLLHGSSYVTYFLAQRWATIHRSEASHSEKGMILPHLEPGPYAACVVKPGSQEWYLLMSGLAMPLDGCVYGTLPPWGSLELELKAPRKESRAAP